MPLSQLLSWADLAATEMIRSLQAYRNNYDIDSVAEVKHALVEFHAVVDEIYEECQARNMIV